jgi:aconitase A
MQENNALVSLYVVRTPEGKYFGGFDPSKGRANFVDDARLGKKFTNKYDIKLRPDEALVELTVDLSSVEVKVSEPFRPRHRVVNHKA